MTDNNPRNDNDPNIWVRALFLGDSLTTGSRDPFGLSWPFYMAHLALADGTTLIPVIEAAASRRSGHLLKAANAAIESSRAREAFVLIGTNDAKDEAPTPSDLLVANIQTISAYCRVHGLREYIMTIPLPLGFGTPGYTGRTVGRIREFNQGLRAAGFPRLVECEDIRDTTDGVHLQPESSRMIAARAWDAVKRERGMT